MLSFNVFSLFLILSIWSLQQVVLNYTLIAISPWMGAAAAFDVFLVIHISTNTNINFAAMKGGVQWMIYVWSLLVKAVLLHQFGEGYRRMIAIAFMLTPVLYAVWSLRASSELYGFSIKILSMESMFHTELAFGVVLDLLDIFSTFDPFAFPTTGITKNLPWIFIFRFVVVMVGLAMHSYSFPTSTESSAPSRRPGDPLMQAMQSDVILTSKHSALVSILVLDIPLLVTRTLIWIDYPTQPGFSIFIIKNIVNLPFSAIRLHRCRIVEKERPRKTQMMYHPLDFINKEVSSVDTSLVGDGDKGRSGRHLSRVADSLLDDGPIRGSQSASVRHRVARGKHVSDASHREAALSPLAEQSSPDEYDLDELSDVDNEEDAATSEGRPAPYSMLEDMPKKKLTKFLGDLRSVRRIPVSGFGFMKCCVKLWHCVRAGSRLGMAGILDETFTLAYWKQLRLCFPILFTAALRITLVTMFRYSILGKPSGPSEWFTWSLVPHDYHVAIYAISVSTFAVFLLFVGTAPFFDVTFISLFWGIRNISFYMTFAIFRDSRIFDVFLQNQAVGAHIEMACKFLFIVPSCLHILTALFPIQSAFLGRHYMFFAVPPANRALNRALMDVSSTNFTVSQLEQDKALRSDEGGWISTAAVLVFHNCRQSFAPISYHELIVGPNLVKSLRAIDLLLSSDWHRILMLVLLKFSTIVIYLDPWYIPFFGAHIILKCVYCLFSQAVRLLSLRRYEIKYLFEEIVQNWRNPEETTSKVSKPMPERRFLSLADILQHYQRHGFFTSPGNLFPPFF